ncbi:unnamed protein product [Parajaminaea phylloscopi]
MASRVVIAASWAPRTLAGKIGSRLFGAKAVRVQPSPVLYDMATGPLAQHSALAPIRIAFKAGEALCGLAEEGSSRGPDKESLQKAQPDRSPLARLLANRLDRAASCLSDLGIDVETQRQAALQASEDELNFRTGEAALLCLSAIDSHLDGVNATTEDRIGSRDRKLVSTLVSLAAQWAFEPCLLEYDSALKRWSLGHKDGTSVQRIKELDSSHDSPHSASAGRDAAEKALTESTKTLQTLLLTVAQLLSRGGELRLVQHIPTQILQSRQPLVAHILGAALRLVHGPRLAASSTDSAQEQTPRALLGLLLRSLPPDTLLASLSAAGTSHSETTDDASPPPFVRQASARLLSAQLLRPEGVTALLATVFGTDGAHHHRNNGRQLEQLATLLTSPPPKFDRQTFILQHTMPVIFQHTRQSTPAAPVFATAAAYTLSRLFSGSDRELATRILTLNVWAPLLRCPPQPTPQSLLLTPADELSASMAALRSLVVNSPETTDWLLFLIEPVLDRVWDLLLVLQSGVQATIAEVNQHTDSIEATKALASATDVVAAWFGVASEAAIVGFHRKLCLRPSPADKRPRLIFKILQGRPELWWDVPPTSSASAVDVASLLNDLRMPGSEGDQHGQGNGAPLALLQAMQGETFGAQSWPEIFVKVLSDTARNSVAAALLSSLLEHYLGSKSSAESQVGGSEDSLLLLHNIVLILDSFGEGLVKDDPEKALRFVSLCLIGTAVPQALSESEATEARPPLIGTSADDAMPFIQARPQGTTGILGDLQEATASSDETIDLTSPAHSPGSAWKDDEVDVDLSRTALELLLSILEKHPGMTPQTSPLLLVIGRSLSNPRLTTQPDEDLRRVLSEARLVLLARGQMNGTAETQDMPIIETPSAKAQRSVEKTYQEALALLQDPIIPVRAHGLVLLRDLIATANDKGSRPTAASEGEALRQSVGRKIQAFVEIFMEAIRDEESYLYLNAVQGVKEAILWDRAQLKLVVAQYSRPTHTGKTGWDRAEVDFRLRLGESLLQAVQRLESAGAMYVDELAIPLCDGLANSSFPTTLRSSFLSLLGTCIEAFPLAMATRGHAKRLAEATIDILRIETTSYVADREDPDNVATPQQSKYPMAPGSDDAVGLDTTYPQLRRGALLLLSLLIRGGRHQVEDDTEAANDELRLRGERDVSLTRLCLPGGAVLGAVTEDAVVGRALDTSELLFRSDLVSSCRVVVKYVEAHDGDPLVRHQSGEVSAELDAFELAMVHRGLTNASV